MKKMLLVLLSALIFVATTELTFAAAQPSAKPATPYFSTLKHPGTKSLAKQSFVNYGTDITVINASANPVELVVPNSPIDDLIMPNDSDHIYNSEWSYPTEIILADRYGVFFDHPVGAHAIVTISREHNEYVVNVVDRNGFQSK